MTLMKFSLTLTNGTNTTRLAPTGKISLDLRQPAPGAPIILVAGPRQLPMSLKQEEALLSPTSSRHSSDVPVWQTPAREAQGNICAGPRSEEHTSELQSQSNLV